LSKFKTQSEIARETASRFDDYQVREGDHLDAGAANAEIGQLRKALQIAYAHHTLLEEELRKHEDNQLNPFRRYMTPYIGRVDDVAAFEVPAMMCTEFHFAMSGFKTTLRQAHGLDFVYHEDLIKQTIVKEGVENAKMHIENAVEVMFTRLRLDRERTAALQRGLKL